MGICMGNLSRNDENYITDNSHSMSSLAHALALSLPLPIFAFVIVATGINDILGSMFIEMRGDINSSMVDSNIASIVPCISAAVSSLIANGEKNVIIATAPAAYATPLAITYAISALLKGWILPLNAALKTAVANLTAEYPAASISLWDAHSVFLQLIADSPGNGFTNTTAPCMVNVATISDPFGFVHPQLVSQCPDPASYGFW